jgi:hypothetical protein
MPVKSANSTNNPPHSNDTKDAATLRLLQAMGLSAVKVAPGVMALSATSRR